ncbi:MAG: antA/AntB antirepressor family protein [Oscillospiraceae bacterium]
MDKLQKTNNQITEKTPIEILIGIDDNGMTTAKKLYDFLELEPKNYSRWCNANILKNKFAEISKDYIPFVVEEERNNPKPTTDYKLTSEFAKQLSMLSKSERGEQARQYFLACEKGLKIAMRRLNTQQLDLSPITDTLLKIQSDILALQQSNQTQAQQQITTLTALITTQLPQPYKPRYTRWMGKTYDKIDKLAEYNGIIRKQMLRKLYTEFQDTYDIDLGEYQEEYCAQHNLQDNGLYTLNTIDADYKLKELFDLMLDTQIEQIELK